MISDFFSAKLKGSIDSTFDHTTSISKKPARTTNHFSLMRSVQEQTVIDEQEVDRESDFNCFIKSSN